MPPTIPSVIAFSRRDIVAASLSATGFAALALPQQALGQDMTLPLTPSCGEQPIVTRRQTEGPFFKPASPLKRDLRGDGPGRVLALSGFVLTRQCRPVAGALMDLWHADDRGDYDNAGFRFRGHQFTDAQGRYQFVTRLPGLYPGRTRHFHVKVQAANGPILTTQLYFPDEAGNARDGIYHHSLLMALTHAEGGATGRFDFIVAG